MSSIQTIEIDSEPIGILTAERAERRFRFHSGVSPYHLLDGSLFSKPSAAFQAVLRLKKAANDDAVALPRRQGGSR